MARGKGKKKIEPDSYRNKEITIYRGACFIKNKQGRRLYLENYDTEPRQNKPDETSVEMTKEIKKLSKSIR